MNESSDTPFAPRVRHPFARWIAVGVSVLVITSACGSAGSAAESVDAAERLSAHGGAGASAATSSGDDPTGRTTSVDHLPAAVATKDFCVVFDAIERVDMEDTKWGSMLGAVESITDAMIDSSAFVPEELEASWASLISGMGLVAAELERDPVDVKALREVSSDPSLASSDEVVSTWAMEHCDH